MKILLIEWARGDNNLKEFTIYKNKCEILHIEDLTKKFNINLDKI